MLFVTVLRYRPAAETRRVRRPTYAVAVGSSFRVSGDSHAEKGHQLPFGGTDRISCTRSGSR